MLLTKWKQLLLAFLKRPPTFDREAAEFFQTATVDREERRAYQGASLSTWKRE